MSNAGKVCVRFKNTDTGRRCAEFGDASNIDHAMVKVTGLGVFDKSVNSTDVLLGAGLGLAGSAGVKAVAKSVFKDAIPDAVHQFMPLLGGIGSAAALYYAQKGSNKSRATGHAVGAVAAGLVVQVYNLLKEKFPDAFGDVVSLKFSGMNGLLINENIPRIGPGGMQGYNGLIVNEPGHALGGYADNPSLRELAQVSMGEDQSGLEELMEMDE